MQKLSILAFLGLLLFVGCSKDKVQPTEQEAIDQTETLSRSAINEIVIDKLHQENKFEWQMVDDHTVWSALINSDNVLSIGYKPSHVNNLSDIIHEIDINDDEWVKAYNTVMNTILEIINKENPNKTVTAEEITVFENKTLPIIDISTTSFEVIKTLRSMEDMVRYVEPSGYSMEDDVEKSDSGCGLSPASSVNSADYTTISPNAKVPWTFTALNVPNAWNYSTGNNIGVAVLDTGTSDDQSKLRGNYTEGYSGNRSVTPRSTHVSGMWWWASLDSPHDQCGHGTQMSGTIAAPRGYGGSTVGVAYEANLRPYRVCEDVVIGSSSEKNGVKDALVEASKRSDVHIFSMSIGDIFSSGKVSDGIDYAHGKGKLMFAAAGTSTSFTSWYGVIFPAWLSKTVAVTGVEDSDNLVSCDVCHEGDDVDLVVTMQRKNDSSRTSLTLAMSGNSPAYVGGSSTATAHTAGVAALVWATNPNQSASQVLQRIKNASQFYPNRHSDYGWGRYDALQAVTN